jgi:hypothetical protein
VGLADRDYMKADYDFRSGRRRRKATWYKRLLFLFYRMERALFKTG